MAESSKIQEKKTCNGNEGGEIGPIARELATKQEKKTLDHAERMHRRGGWGVGGEKKNLVLPMKSFAA